MKNYLYSLLLVFAFWATAFQSFASHMVGSDISYSCTSTPGIWHVKIAMYRDCSGIPLGNCSGGCSSGCSYTLSWASIDTGYNYAGTFSCSLTSVSDVNPNPLCSNSKSTCTNMGCETAGSFTPGIEKYVFEGNVNLGSSVLPSTCCNVRIYWQECCRNAAITTGAAGNNFYIEALINRCAAANNPCNSSPEFSNDPFAILCGGQAVTFNIGAIDPDHDSLSYAFAPALQSLGTSVTYTPPYAYDVPMPFYPPKNGPFPLGISCDANTGDVMFTPSYGAGGQFVGVMAIEIKEWRNINGMATCIGITRRDMQTWLISCPPNYPPTIMTDPSNGLQPKISWQVRAGNQICFYVLGKDTDYLPYNTPSISDTTYISWNASLAPKGATFTPTYNPANRKTSGPREDKYQFCWHPTEADASTTPYYFTVSTKDSRCPYPAGQATRAISILVIGNADVTISKTNLSCSGWSLSYIKNKPSQVFVSTAWNISKIANDFSLSNVNTYLNMQNPPIQNFASRGKYLVQLLINSAGPNGQGTFQNQFFDTLYVDTFLNIVVRDTTSCMANPITIRPIINHYGTNPPYQYKWFDASQSSTILSISDSFVVVPSASKIFTLQVSDSLNCVNSKNFNVYGKPVTPVISGNISAKKNSIDYYWVNAIPFTNYYWTITNGTQNSGGFSESISVKWDDQNSGLIVVQESNLHCMSDTNFLAVNLTTNGINENKVFDKFSVFPNPTSGILNIEFETSEKNIQIEVMDMIGKSILKNTTKHDGGLFQKTLNISQLNEGFYFLKITAGEKSTTVKVTLE